MENKNNMELAKDFLKECNTTKGRWNRQKFWLYPIILMLIIFITILIIISISEPIWLILLFIWYFYIAYVSVVAYIKRLRDLDKNPWLALLLLIPFVSLYLFVICGFFKGTEGVNKFGPDPLDKNDTETKEKNQTTEL